MAVTSFYDNTEELNSILQKNLENILTNVLNGNYIYFEDDMEDYDPCIIILVDHLIFVLARNSSNCSESTVSIEEIPDNKDDAIQEVDRENFAEAFWLALATEEDAAAVSEGIEPAEEDTAVQLSDEAAETGKRFNPRRNMFSTGWKRVKRVFRALCCCGRGQNRR